MMNRNESYKDSGVGWIGNIPKHWEVSKFKYFFNFGMGETILKKNLSKEGVPVLSATEKYTILGYYKNPNLILDIGDLVIPARGISIGHVKIVKEKCVSTQTTIYGKKKVSIDMIFVQFFCIGYRDNLFQFVQTAIPQITVEQVKNNPILLPPLEEQILISRYLDKRTEQIDSLIEKLQKKIELLKERRASLINQCVTKGLTPNIEVKDSGIKWIGQIPKHWEVKKLKFVSSQISEKRFPMDGDIKISPENVVSQTGKILNFFSKYDTEGQSFTHGDILFNKLRVYLNKVVLCDFEGLSMGEMIVIRPETILGNYLHRVLNSAGFIDHVNSLSEGVKLPRPPVAGIFNSFVPVPPKNEQVKISEYLDSNLVKIDDIVEKYLDRISLISEYRQSLISSVVTGKIRITKDMA